jgi:hypothetical protein
MDRKIGYMISESAAMPVAEFKIVKEDLNVPNSPYRVTASGVLQTGNQKNRNGRIYRTEDLAREIAAPRQIELLSTGNMLGRCGHPIGPDAQSLVVQQTIDPKECDVRFLKFWMDGDNVWANFMGTNNDLGETFDKDLRIGVLPAFSLRALGTLKASPQGAFVENLKMITYDHVIYPSHPTAYTKGILSESSNIIDLPESSFKFTDEMDGTKSHIYEFTNEDAIKSISMIKEAAVDYVKDKSLNFHLLKECYDMTKIDTIDISSNNKLILTEAGKNTIVMDIEDYIAKEIQNYK